MAITTELETILNARYGREVRQAIHDGIKQAYEDAIKNGNANMEVSQARGTYNTLAERLMNLDKVDRDNLNELTVLLADKIKKGQVTMADLTQEVKEALTGGAVAVVGEGSVGYSAMKDEVLYADGYMTKRIPLIAKNGGFDNLDNWRLNNATIVDGKLRFNLTNPFYVTQTLAKPIPSGHKIFFKADIESSNPTRNFRVRLIHSEGSQDSYVTPSYRGLVIESEFETTEIGLARQSAGTEDFVVDNLIMVDLTALYGAGKEPSYLDFRKLLDEKCYIHFSGNYIEQGYINKSIFTDDLGTKVVMGSAMSDHLVVEKKGTNHIENYTYTGFTSGINYDGREIHVSRTATSHTSTDGRLIVHVKNKNGGFDKKLIGGIDYSVGAFRDPIISWNPRTGLPFITIAVKNNVGQFTGYWLDLDTNLDCVQQIEMTGMIGYFKWGNVLPTPDGSFIFTGYSPGALEDKVVLFKTNETTRTDTTIEVEKVTTLFGLTEFDATECTIGHWGKKLVTITRNNKGTLQARETLDLTGATGWGDVIELGFRGDCPTLLPYTPADEPLALSTCSWSYKGVPGRSPHITLYKELGLDVPKIDIEVALLEKNGGYPSMVKTNNGIGMMYYEELDSTKTGLFYKEVNIDHGKMLLESHYNLA